MADTTLQLDDSFVLNDQAGISVGFKSEEAITPLKEMLAALFNKEIEETKKQHNAQVAQSIKIEQELKKNRNEQKERDDRNYKLSNDVKKHLEELSKENRQNWRVLTSYLKTAVSVVTKAADNYMKQSVELANVFRDIESGGVFVKNGFNSLSETAYELGMTYEELSGNLRKTSPLIAKLNASMGDGVKIFQRSLAGISDSLNLSHDEQVAVWEATMNELSPSQLRQMSEQQLIMRVDETARQMKLLSMATGKSVENIKAENDMKAKSLRVDAFKRANPNAMKALSAIGITDDETIDYILSGGVRTSSKIVGQMANDPLRQAVFPELIRLAKSGQLNFDSMAKLQSQYGHLAQYKTNMALANANNQGMYAAASISPIFEGMVYDDTFGQGFIASDLAGMAEQYNSEARQSSNRVLRNAQDYRENMNNMKTRKQDLQTGGTEGIANGLGFFGELYGWGASALNGVKSGIDWLGFDGTTSALLSNILGDTMPSIGNYIGGKMGLGIYGAVNKFDKSVDKFSNAVNGRTGRSGSSKDMSFADRMWNQMFRKNKYGRRASAFMRKYVTGTGTNSLATKVANYVGKANPLALLGRTIGVIGGSSLLMENIFGDNKGESKLSSTLKGAIYGGVLGGSIGGFKGAFWGAVIGGSASYISNVIQNWQSGKGIMENLGFGSSQPKQSEYSSINKKSVIANSNGGTTTVVLDNEFRQAMIDTARYNKESAQTAKAVYNNEQLKGVHNGKSMNT